jgi:transposase InsO family protein
VWSLWARVLCASKHLWKTCFIVFHRCGRIHTLFVLGRRSVSKSAIPQRYRFKVKQRLAVVRYAREHGIKPASRHFGCTPRTVRTWVRRWRTDGDVGLVPKYPQKRKRRLPERTVELLRVARAEHGFGAPRARVWLERVHCVRVNARTIQRVFRDLGMPVLPKTRRRRPRQLKLFEKDQPGDSVQVDVKVVRVAKAKLFQYTAIDDCTRMRVLRLYPHLSQHASLDFLRELTTAFPFAIRKIQCDNGPEFPLAFRLSVEGAGMRHRYITPRRPQQNGKVERSHRIDSQEFWGRQTFTTRAEAEEALREWEHRYNHERFSLALGGLTPAEKLAAKLATPATAPSSTPAA